MNICIAPGGDIWLQPAPAHLFSVDVVKTFDQILAQERFGISRRFDVRSQQQGEIKLRGEATAGQRLRLVIEGVKFRG